MTASEDGPEYAIGARVSHTGDGSNGPAMTSAANRSSTTTR